MQDWVSTRAKASVEIYVAELQHKFSFDSFSGLVCTKGQSLYHKIQDAFCIILVQNRCLWKAETIGFLEVNLFVTASFEQSLL